MKGTQATYSFYRVLALLAIWSASEAAMAIEVKEEIFGRTAEGQAVGLWTLENDHGLKAKVMTYGATLVRVDVPDREGRVEPVTLYLDSLADYLAGHPLFGSIVGRYANRIAGGGFTLDGILCKLETVNPKTGVHIHGGETGFQRQNWSARPLKETDSTGVEMSLTSPDGHEGYPGTVRVVVTYRLTNDNELRLEYSAETDKPTHVNLTNHVYWNLAGAGSGDVLDQVLTLHADRYLAVDDKKIPTGEMVEVSGTAMDFTGPRALGERIGEVSGGGYDHCYVINRDRDGELVPAARAVDPGSGRVMDVWTTEPGVQLYTANYLKGTLGANGRSYGPHHGFCLETQHYPDSPNRPEFPSTVLRPGETYRQVTVYQFGLLEEHGK